ncbi:hypothetical protein SIN8267_01715 [Sinobacterium norvegicum]|uniref:Sulfotransferase n=1 Tax=Sinobacterium norvegicum TaxID=1641715 RepID=A0ABN8EH35_9GAMM|nr:sulfotransferase [Sinobacterium norvegicum]CAH0991606.1 hypothetical protein SIN8267_01715 [Sinobacterium norvegicum]
MPAPRRSKSKKNAKKLAKSITLKLGPRPAISLSIQQALHLCQQHLKKQQTSTAKAILLQINQQQPDLLEVDLMMSDILDSAAQYDDLLLHAKASVQRHPRQVSCLLGLATALRHLQRHTEAEAILLKAQKLAPGNAQVFNHLGIIQKESGQLDNALANFDRGLAINPKLSEIYWNRADLDHSDNPVLLTQMQTLTNSPQCGDNAAARLHYAMAKYYRHQQQTEPEFEQLRLGAKRKKNTLNYQHQEELNRHDEVIHCFDQTFFQQQLAATLPESSTTTPIFVCGMARSGTTLVEQIISSHSDVIAGDERPDLLNATAEHLQKSRNEQPYPQWAKDFKQRDWQAIGHQYRVTTNDLGQRRMFTDKWLSHYEAIGLIHLALPDAKIIHLQRNPMDNLFGCFKQLFQQGIAYSYDFNELAEYYHSYRQLMAHWDAVLPGKVYHIQYEQLVTNQQQTTAELLAFLGLEWQQNCVDFHHNSRPVRTVSSSQVRQPMSEANINNWRRYERQLEPLKQRLIELGYSSEL